MYDKNRKYDINLTLKGLEEIDDIDNFKIEIELDFLKGFYVRGMYKKKFDKPVLLSETFYDDFELILDDDKFQRIILTTLEDVADKRNILIDVDLKLENLKYMDIKLK